MTQAAPILLVRKIAKDLANFPLFVVTVAILFWLNKELLFLGYDGAYMRQLIAEDFTFNTPLFSNNLSMLQGVGDVAFPLQFKLSLAAQIGHALGMTHPGGLVAYYTTVAIELFLATFLCGRIMGLQRGWSAAAAWLCAISVLPTLPVTLLYPVATIGPWLIEQVACTTLAIGLILLLVREDAPRTLQALYIFLLGIIAFYLALYVPITATLSVVWMAFAFVGINLRAANRGWLGNLKPRLSFVFVSLILAATVVPYLLGLSLSSVTAFFTPELIANRPRIEFISILYYGPIGQGWYNTVVYLLGIGASIYLSFERGRDDARTLAATCLVYCLCLQALGLYILYSVGDYTAIWPLYFEWQIWPFLFLFAALAASKLAVSSTCHRWMATARGEMRHVLDLRPVMAVIHSPRGALPLWTAAAISMVIVSLALQFAKKRSDPTPFPPRETELIAALKRQIGLSLDGQWRGSLLNIVGAHGQSNDITWNTQNGIDAKLTYSHGNDSRAWGLWWQGIPTIFSYNQYMSPFYYAYATRAFSTPQDRQQRGVLILTKPGYAAQRTIGAKFLLTEYLLPDPGDFRFLARFSTQPPPHFPGQVPYEIGFDFYYLYEVPDANPGQFSPIEVKHVETADQTLKQILSPQFDAAHTVVTSEDIHHALVQPTSVDARLSYSEARLHVETNGHSLMVLPITYSHCLNVRASEGHARLIRVNLVQTGVLVEGPTMARINYGNSPLVSPYCKIQDWRDGVKMNLRGIAPPTR